MRTTVTDRGQVSIPVEVRNRLGIGPGTRLEWIVEGTELRVVPIPADAIGAFRGSVRQGATDRLLHDRRRDR